VWRSDTVNTPDGTSFSIHDILQSQTSLELDEKSVHRYRQENNIPANPGKMNAYYIKKAIGEELGFGIQSLSSAREIETFLSQHNMKANKHTQTFFLLLIIN